MIYFEVLIFLIVILIAALIFTNALEHLGARLGFSEGVTGSIFAAVGTALAETMIGAVWLRLMLIRGHLKVWQMLINGALYGGYLGTVLSIG
jgi:cation:H+ antiporter